MQGHVRSGGGAYTPELVWNWLLVDTPLVWMANHKSHSILALFFPSALILVKATELPTTK